MNPVVARRIKIGIGLVLGVLIGAFCRVLHIPSPAPPVIAGAALVLSMTLGYLAMDRYCVHEALHRDHCGGPDGGTRK